MTLSVGTPAIAGSFNAWSSSIGTPGRHHPVRAGWSKTVGTAARTMLRGTVRVGFQFTLNIVAYNLARLPKLLAA
jgi:hypothetical protein